MPAIGPHFESTLSALIVKIEYERRILVPTFRCGYLHDVVSFPQAISIPESGNPTFSANARPRKHDEFLHSEMIYARSTNDQLFFFAATLVAVFLAVVFAAVFVVFFATFTDL